MTYRNFAKPDIKQLTTTDDWVKWAENEGILPSVGPAFQPSCRDCYGAVPEDFFGDHYPTCYPCHTYAGSGLDAFFAIVYSRESGLESLLHRYKDFGPQYRWMALPLGSIVSEFLQLHLSCIEERYGSIDFATTVPSGNSSRGFDHLAVLIRSVNEWPVEWVTGVLTKVKPGRPSRQQAEPTFYDVPEPGEVAGKTILLFDDVWTSGSSFVSSGMRLKEAGAETVVGLAIGRQLGEDWGSSGELIQAIAARGYDKSICEICG